MKHCAIIAAAALALTGATASAQDAAPAADATAAGETATEETVAQDTVQRVVIEAEESGPITWYALFAISQRMTDRGCVDPFYKLSTSEPVVFEGPEELNAYHADELIAQFMLYLSERAPTAFNWFNGAEGHQSPQVYFRRSEEEVFEAFRRDGHLRRNRGCYGEVLVTQKTSRFTFEPPVNFAESDFGAIQGPSRSPVVVRELRKIPGAE